MHIHVATNGDDSNSGAENAPLRNIATAAERAQPGDEVIVYAGLYRERIDPPRGGTSESERITYRAAEGDLVEIRGSEVITGWERIENNLWRVSVSNAVFGDFNPFTDCLHGDWFNDMGREHHTGSVYLDAHWLTEAATHEALIAKPQHWHAQVDAEQTTLYANFGTLDPNEATTEISVRQSVFYPSKPGINYITVKGFTMRHAATPWAPPTVEQIGLIGTHWSRGWIIEDTVISHSACSGITLGKYGEPADVTNVKERILSGADGADQYTDTVRRAVKHGWNYDTIGSHIVRNNHISHCEQTGICGSLGGICSQITGNVIHDIYVRRLFTGCEQAGIKLHAPLDTLIEGNYIYRTINALWMDWMTQGTRITGNLCHDNDDQDLFVEVNHGPFVVDNNLFFSPVACLNASQGGAYLHNLFAGVFKQRAEPERTTPYQLPHSTAIGGRSKIAGGDDRYYNNIFCTAPGLGEFDNTGHPIWSAGNVYLNGAKPSAHDTDAVIATDVKAPKLIFKGEQVSMQFEGIEKWLQSSNNSVVTSALLGQAKLSGVAFKDFNGQTLHVGNDALNQTRPLSHPSAGPLENNSLKVSTLLWPKRKQ
jgi:alpha-N-arabinofuranosidase